MVTESHFDLDEWVVAGYDYAAGCGGIPSLENQFHIDAFNIGIRLYNEKHGARASLVAEGIRSVRHDNCSGRADKEIAIICNH